MRIRSVVFAVIIASAISSFAQNPVVSAVSPTKGSIGTSVTVTGSGFGSAQGSSAITFNGAAAAVSTWSDTQIVATVPSTSSGSVVVTVSGTSSNSSVSFTVPAHIDSVSPQSGLSGTTVTLIGTNFGPSTQGGRYIWYGAGNSAYAITWTDTQVSFQITGSGAVPIYLQTGSQTSNTVNFTVISPTITGISPATGYIGTTVTITGSNFGATQGSNQITFNGSYASVSSWSDTQIVATVPATRSGPVVVTVAGANSNSNFSFSIPTPHIDTVSPPTGPSGTTVTLNGSNFGPSTQPGRFIWYGPGYAYSAYIMSWTDTQISFQINGVTGTVPIYLQIGAQSSNSVNFTATQPPAITGISPTTGYIGTAVTITGSNFGATQGSSLVTFNGGYPSVSSWSDTQIVATVPAVTTGSVVVTVAGASSNSNFVFSVPVPHIDSVSPQTGEAGTTFTLTGSNFGPSTQPGRYIWYGPGYAYSASAISWTDTQVSFQVSGVSGAAPVYLQIGAQNSNSVTFTTTPPIITGISPTTGYIGTPVTITGTNFGANTGGVTFNGNNAWISSWSDTQIVAISAPTTTGPVVVQTGGMSSNSNFTYTYPVPTITAISPTAGGPGNQVAITGTHFAPTRNVASVLFSSANAPIVSWSDTLILATVPTGVTGTVPVYVTMAGANSNSVNFSLPSYAVRSISPTTGPVGTQVTITGTGFGSAQGTSSVGFAGVPSTAVQSWSDTEVVASVPDSASTGPVTVSLDGVASNANVIYQIPGPQENNSVSPTMGTAGTSVTITGSGFRSQQYDSTVTFNGAAANIVSWSDTEIVASVPPQGTSGAVVVTVKGKSTDPSPGFTVIPQVSSVSPANGLENTQVTITGSGFGGAQGSSTVTFNDVYASVLSWSATQIVVAVPSTASTGPVVVQVNSNNSNSDFVFQVVPLVVSVTDSLGNQSTYSNSVYGGTRYITDSTGTGCSTCTVRGIVHRGFDGQGNVISSTDALGHLSSYGYDGAGNLASQSAYLDTNTPVTTSYTYNSFGEVLTATDRTGQYHHEHVRRTRQLADHNNPSPEWGKWRQRHAIRL